MWPLGHHFLLSYEWEYCLGCPWWLIAHLLCVCRNRLFHHHDHILPQDHLHKMVILNPIFLLSNRVKLRLISPDKKVYRWLDHYDPETNWYKYLFGKKKCIGHNLYQLVQNFLSLKVDRLRKSHFNRQKTFLYILYYFFLFHSS